MPVRQVLYLSRSTQVPASQTDLEVAAVRMPKSGRIRSVYVFCRALATTVTVDVWKNGATILTADVTPTAGAQVAGTIDLSKSAFAPGDEIHVVVTTAASSTIDDLGVSLYLA